MDSVLQISRIIFLGLLSGPLLFAGIIEFTLQDRPLQSNPEIVQVAAGMALVLLIASYFLPGFLSKKQAADFPRSYLSVKIVQWALLEGGALLNLVAYYLTAEKISMWTAVALLIALLIRIPSKGDMDRLFPADLRHK